MTEPPRTLQERLRDAVAFLEQPPPPKNPPPKQLLTGLLREVADALAEAREALEPFAKSADDFIIWSDATFPLSLEHSESSKAHCTVGDLRKARAVLAKLKG